MTMTADDRPVPRPAVIPPRKPTIETRAKAERAKRRREGPKTRLTQKLVDDIVASARVGTPLQLCYDFAGVSASTVAYWMRTATDAENRPWNSRTQLERRCILFREELRKAQGEAGLRVHQAMADLAGITATRPTVRVERHKIVGGTLDERGRLSGGQVVESQIEVREVPPQVAAVRAIGQYRFPEAMGVVEAPEPEQPAQPVSTRALYERLQQVRREREEAGIVDAEVIDSGTPDELAR